ncbi:MAG: hypothetical protein ACKVQB_01780 [Bacteroidia bacterium]
MKKIKRGLTLLLIVLNHYSFGQVGFGIKAGFQQSIPLVMRDSFSGKPSLSGGINFYFPAMDNLSIVSGLSYREVAINHKIDPISLTWQAIGLNLGTEWTHYKFYKTKFYAGFNANYILGFGKTVLSGSTSSGSIYNKLELKNKLIPSVELGLTFNPRPYINVSFSTIQPVYQTVSFGKPTLPGSLSFGIEYRINSRDLKNWKRDTTPFAEKLFTNNLKNGTLYFIEDGTDSSQRLFRKMIYEFYDYSKVRFINGNSLNDSLISFKTASNPNLIFIVKTGTVVYNMERAATQGLIVYNYKMENPMPDSPFFVRNLAGDIFLQDPLVVKKLIKTLNNRLYKMYNVYRK